VVGEFCTTAGLAPVFGAQGIIADALGWRECAEAAHSWPDEVDVTPKGANSTIGTIVAFNAAHDGFAGDGAVFTNRPVANGCPAFEAANAASDAASKCTDALFGVAIAGGDFAASGGSGLPPTGTGDPVAAAAAGTAERPDATTRHGTTPAHKTCRQR